MSDAWQLHQHSAQHSQITKGTARVLRILFWSSSGTALTQEPGVWDGAIWGSRLELEAQERQPRRAMEIEHESLTRACVRAWQEPESRESTDVGGDAVTKHRAHTRARG
jgi:hypothetical protein